jgi:hypothetical protein
LGNGAASGDSRRTQIASRALDDAKQMGSELLTAACDSVTALADEQRRRAADQIAAVGDALRSSAQSLDRDTGLPVGGYGNDAAGRLNDFAQTVRTREWADFARDLEGFARSQPMAFVAAALGIGFVAGRFLFSAPMPVPQVPAAPMPQPQRPANEPRGGVRYDYGAVSGPVSGDVRAGYGTAREGGA